MQFPDRVRIVFDSTTKSPHKAIHIYDLDTGEEVVNAEGLHLEADAYHAPAVEIVYRIPADDPIRDPNGKRVTISYSWPNFEIVAINEK
jgi:hypothetical protein